MSDFVIMRFNDDWKQICPITSVLSHALLKSDEFENHHHQNSVGPLFFNPSPQTLIEIFSSASYLSPRLAPPFPSLTLQRFLSTTSSSPLVYSTASSLVSDKTITQSDCNTNDGKLNNSLQLLTCPFTSTIYAFLPAGENLENIGMLAISVNKKSNFEVKHNNGKPFVVENNAYQHRITQLLINPITDCFRSSEDNEGFVTIAYMLACCKYSVSWYSINVRKNVDSSSSRCPVVECIGSKWFRSSGVVHACWSPHLVEESAVLLENGEIFLYALNSCSKNNKLVGKKLRIVRDTAGEKPMKLGGANVWLACEFSWHPKILIVAHSSRLFLVDMRPGDCQVTNLLSIEKVSARKNDEFVALARADGLFVCVASKELLLLCDVSKPKRPLLRWVHCLGSPSYINVLKLSALRSNSSEKMYNWASKCGYCILLGSFWDGEFNTFYYGPDNDEATCLLKSSTVNNHFFAWGLPSDISLSGRICHCGTCLLREEYCKETLHRWIDWRQKKDLVMGFGFVEQDIASQLGGPDNFGGFHLIRLMSSGKLEVQRYCASWKLENIYEKTHKESISYEENYNLYDIGELKYDLPKRHQFLMLARMKKCLLDNNISATSEFNGNTFDDYAVNLGDDTDNLTQEVPETKYSPFQLKTPVHANMPGVNQSNMRSNPEKSTPFTSTNQSSAYDAKKEAVGLELFDEGCSYDLKFNDHEIDLGQQEFQMSNRLAAHKLLFQKDFKLWQL